MPKLNPKLSQVHCEKPVNLFSKLFLYKNVSRFPIIWNSNSCQFISLVHSQNHKVSNAICYFLMYIVSGVIGLLANLIVLTDPKSDFNSIVRSFLYLTLGLLTTSSFYVTLNNAHNLVFGLNAMRHLRLQLHVRLQRNLACSNEQFWKITSILMRLVTVFLSILPYIVTILALQRNIDPAGLALYRLFPKLKSVYNPLLNISVKIMRYVFQFIRAAELLRFMCFYTTSLLYLLETQTKSIEFLLKLPKGAHHDLTFFGWYNASKIAHQAVEHALNSLLGILLGCGLVTWVSVNVICFKCFGRMPILVYIKFPVGSLIWAYVAQVTFYLTIKICLISSRLILKRRREANAILERKLRKTWRSVRPIVYKCGPFWSLERGADILRYHTAFLRTMEGLLI